MMSRFPTMPTAAGTGPHCLWFARCTTCKTWVTSHVFRFISEVTLTNAVTPTFVRASWLQLITGGFPTVPPGGRAWAQGNPRPARCTPLATQSTCPCSSTFVAMAALKDVTPPLWGSCLSFPCKRWCLPTLPWSLRATSVVRWDQIGWNCCRINSTSCLCKHCHSRSSIWSPCTYQLWPKLPFCLYCHPCPYPHNNAWTWTLQWGWQQEPAEQQTMPQWMHQLGSLLSLVKAPQRHSWNCLHPWPLHLPQQPPPC